MKNEQLYKTAIKWLNKNYGDLELYETGTNIKSTYFIKNEEIILDYNKEHEVVWVSYTEIWSFLRDFFSLDNTQTEKITKLWMEEHYKLKVTRAHERYIKLFI
jgi:hypothetical protein